MEKFTNEIAETIKSWMESDDVKSIIATTKKASDADTGTFEMVITTENLDRYQEVIKMDGWEIEHYMKNPVVLWGHDHKILIGVSTSLEVVDGKMVAKGKFAPTAEGQEKRKLYDAGFLRASSVGFIEKEREGNLITKSELIEWSFVSVPANPYALSTMMKAGHDVNMLVTKGILTIKAEEEETPAPEPVPAAEVPAADVNDELAEKVASLVVSKLKASDVVLDAQETPAPEHNEEPAAEPTEDEKALEAHNAKKVVQKAATILGEILAEWRQKEAK